MITSYEIVQEQNYAQENNTAQPLTLTAEVFFMTITLVSI